MLIPDDIDRLMSSIEMRLIDSLAAASCEAPRDSETALQSRFFSAYSL